MNRLTKSRVDVDARSALDMDGNTLCSKSIGLEALGPEPESTMVAPLPTLSPATAGAIAAH